MDVSDTIYTTRVMRRRSPQPLPDDLLPRLADRRALVAETGRRRR